MPIQYTRLFQLLSEKNISKTELQKRIGMSSTTMAKLSKNENVSIKIIDDICKTLNCQPGDIMEMSNITDNILLNVLREEKAMKLKGGLYHQTQVKLAYNSNRIEGSKLSEDQTRYIYETNTIATEKEETASIDDIIETIKATSSTREQIVTQPPMDLMAGIGSMMAPIRVQVGGAVIFVLNVERFEHA